MTRLAIACAFFFLSFHATAQNYFSCDFENGIPADFTLIDYDGNTPSASMKKAGFDVGIPWVATTVTSNGINKVASSTSWYSPAGTSDDWMITEEINFGVNPTKYNTCIKSYLPNNNTSYTMNYSVKVNFNNT